MHTYSCRGPHIHLAFTFTDGRRRIARLIITVTTEQHIAYVAGGRERYDSVGLLAAEDDQATPQAAADRCDTRQCTCSIASAS